MNQPAVHANQGCNLRTAERSDESMEAVLTRALPQGGNGGAYGPGDFIVSDPRFVRSGEGLSKAAT